METIPAEIVVTLLRYAFRGWKNVYIEANQKGVFARWHAITLHDKVAADMLAISHTTGRMVIFSQDAKTQTVTADFMEIKPN